MRVSTKRGMSASARKQSKKGQFTLFVILGFVILVSFIFLIASRASLVDQQLQLQADRQIKDYVDKSAIQQYVESCLSAVTDEAVIRVTTEGGRINPKGTVFENYVPFYDQKRAENINVSIA